MHTLNVKRTGVAVGAFAGLVHLIWSLLVAAGLSQSIMDWKTGMHFLNNPFHTMPFNLAVSIELIISSLIGGYIFGALFAWVWNTVNK